MKWAGDSEIQALAREHSAAAIAALVKALDDPDRAIAAAIALLDRAYGKPAQAVIASIDGDLTVSGIDKPPEITESYEDWLERRRAELAAIEAEASQRQ